MCRHDLGTLADPDPLEWWSEYLQQGVTPKNVEEYSSLILEISSITVLVVFRYNRVWLARECVWDYIELSWHVQRIEPEWEKFCLLLTDPMVLYRSQLCVSGWDSYQQFVISGKNKVRVPRRKNLHLLAAQAAALASPTMITCMSNLYWLVALHTLPPLLRSSRDNLPHRNQTRG